MEDNTTTYHDETADELSPHPLQDVSAHSEERTISVEEGLGNQDLGAQEEEKSDEDEKIEEVLEVLVPKVAQKKWVFKVPHSDNQFEFIQKPLSFIGKMEWFSLIGDVLDSAMGGENPLTVNSLFAGPANRGGQFTLQDFQDADMFVHAIGKLLKYSPDFLADSYCIWLNVKIYDRPLIKEIMLQSPEDGGLSDEDGFEMIEIFIDQNYGEIERFFRERIAQLQKRIRARGKEASESRLSRR